MKPLSILLILVVFNKILMHRLMSSAGRHHQVLVSTVKTGMNLHIKYIFYRCVGRYAS